MIKKSTVSGHGRELLGRTEENGIVFLRLKTESVPLTDGFAGVELGFAVSRHVSLVLSSQGVQLVFDDVLTLGHAEEAVPVPWRDADRQTHRDIEQKGHSHAGAARRLRE